jgi:hypothetical protein
MSYNPAVKVYYISETDGGPNENNRLVPAPKISIGQEMIYANDTVIGYSFIININGYATSLDLRNIVPGTTYDFDDTVGAIDKFKDIITSNGGIFLVTDNNGKEILKATGGTLRSVNIDQSDNRWVNYAPYTAEIEFNELWLGDCDGLVDKTCGLIFDGLTESPYLLDMKKYRVKSFSDSVSFELSDDTMYNSFTLGSLGIHNQHFNITYKIDAVGKHYFNKTNFQLMPAWEQAKRFIQYKLIEQIRNRLSSTFMQRASDGCSGIHELANLYSANSPGIISDIDNNFQIYNETITCESSESEGSFSATYNAIIKRKNSGTESSVLHTFSRTANTTDDGQNRNVSITVNGNIQGLIETGLIETPNILQLPDNGSIFAYNDGSTNSRYSKALAAFSDIATKEDLNSNIKTFFEINNDKLGVTGTCIDPSGQPPPSSHNISHNYIEGSIGYETTYTTERACSPSGTGFTNVSVTVEDEVDIVAEFIIPGRAKGPIIQKIGSKTPRKVNINIDGTVDKKCCVDFTTLYDDACAGLPLPSGIPSANIAGMKLTQDQFVSNPLDGSYSVSRAYICCDG